MTPEQLVAALAPVVRAYVATAAAGVKGELERTVAAIPTGPPGPPGAPGTDGAPGAPGRDGLDGAGIEDVAVDYDGERTVTLRVTRAGIVKAFPIVLAIPLDRGGWSATRTYTKGDLVTYHGHGWICQSPLTAGSKPGEGGAWRLAIRGADKRDRDHGGAAAHA